MYKKYKIHNFLSIYLHNNISDNLLNEINFQIGSHYDCESTEIDNKSIVVIPFNNENIKNNSILYGEKFLDGESCLVNEELMIRKDNKREIIYIYTKYSNFLITQYIQYFLLKNNSTFIHAGAYVNNDCESTIITGAGGVGKTAILNYAKINGNKIQGDDLVIINGNSSFSFLRKFIFKKYHQNQYSDYISIIDKVNSMKSYLIKILYKNLPLIPLIKYVLKRLGVYNVVSGMLIPRDYLAAVPISKVFGNKYISNEAIIKRIIFIERAEVESIKRVDVNIDSLSNKILSIINYEFKEYYKQYISLCCVNIFNFSENILSEKKIIDNLLSNSEYIFLKIPVKENIENISNYFHKNGYFD